MDKQTTDRLAIVLGQLADITGKLRLETNARDAIERLLTDALAKADGRDRAARETVRTTEPNKYPSLCSITFNVPRDWLPQSIQTALRPDIQSSVKIFEILLRIFLHTYTVQSKLYEESIIEQAGNLAPLLQLQRASITDLNLPSDILTLARAIDPLVDDSQPIREEPLS